MKLIQNLSNKLIIRQFVKFCIIGTINTGLDYAVYLFFSRIVGLYFLYANFVAILVAMTSSFIANKFWTFRNNDKAIKSQYLKFALVNVVYFIINNSIVFSLVHFFMVKDLLAKLAAIFVGLIWNFFANRHWTFKDKVNN